MVFIFLLLFFLFEIIYEIIICFQFYLLQLFYLSDLAHMFLIKLKKIKTLISYYLTYFSNIAKY
jgi:hypothetical protein